MKKIILGIAIIAIFISCAKQNKETDNQKELSLDVNLKKVDSINEKNLSNFNPDKEENTDSDLKKRNQYQYALINQAGIKLKSKPAVNSEDIVPLYKDFL